MGLGEAGFLADLSSGPAQHQAVSLRAQVIWSQLSGGALGELALFLDLPVALVFQGWKDFQAHWGQLLPGPETPLWWPSVTFSFGLPWFLLPI